jgi:ParB-like chromosome segregation protein Spo0J
MKIVMMRPDELKPYERNPRVNDKAVDGVARSIQEFGFRQPIVVDSENVIVCGHTRWKAAQKLGLRSIRKASGETHHLPRGPPPAYLPHPGCKLV